MPSPHPFANFGVPVTGDPDCSVEVSQRVVFEEREEHSAIRVDVWSVSRNTTFIKLVTYVRVPISLKDYAIALTPKIPNFLR